MTCQQDSRFLAEVWERKGRQEICEGLNLPSLPLETRKEPWAKACGGLQKLGMFLIKKMETSGQTQELNFVNNLDEQGNDFFPKVCRKGHSLSDK